MKKNILMMMIAMASMLMAGCGSSKHAVAYQQPTQPQAGNPFGETYTMPTFEPDTEEYFAATGTANGPRARMDVLQRAALSNAQSMIRAKMKHAYKGVVSDYSNYMGMGNASEAMGKMEAGGDQIIDAVVNETMARDVRFSSVDAKGNVDCYVGIRIYKKQVVDKVIDGLTEDQELKLRFNEDQFRKRMEQVFKDYKESQQK